jgi:hypothetical protein
LLDERLVIVNCAERGDRPVRPPLPDDELAASLLEGRKVGVGPIVDTSERQQLGVVLQVEPEILELERARRVAPYPLDRLERFIWDTALD